MFNIKMTIYFGDLNFTCPRLTYYKEIMKIGVRKQNKAVSLATTKTFDIRKHETNI